MRIRHVMAGVVAASAAVAAAVVLPMAASAGERTEYTVLAERGVSGADAVAAIEAAGGEIISRNDAVGMYRVASGDTSFATDARQADALVGAARRTPIGYAPKARAAAPTRSRPSTGPRRAVRPAAPPAPPQQRRWTRSTTSCGAWTW